MTRPGKLGLLMAASMGIVAWMFATTLLHRAAPAAGVPVAPPASQCADAVERVQAYQAPGQREPLADAIAASAGSHPTSGMAIAR